MFIKLVKAQFILSLTSFIFLVSFPEKAVSESYKKDLLAIEAIKSSQPKEFASRLSAISNDFAKFNQEEINLYNYLKGYSYAYVGDYYNAEKLLKSVTQSSNSSDLIYKSLTSLINMSAIKRNYAEGYLYLNQLLQIEDKILSPQLKLRGLVLSALFYNQLGEYSQSLELTNKILSSASDDRTLCVAQHLKLRSLFYLGELDFDDKQINEAEINCSKSNEYIYLGFVKALKAKILIEELQYSDAQQILLKTLTIAEETKYKRLLSEVYYLLALTDWQLNQYEDSEKYASMAIDAAQDATATQTTVESHNLLYKLSKRAGNHEKALEHYVRYAYSDKLFLDDLTAKELAVQQIKHQTAEKNRQIELLNKQNEVLKLEQDLSKQEASNNRLMVILLIFILTSLAFWTYRVKRNQIKLKRQSETDLLTGVSSRQHFYFMCRKTLEQAKKTNQEVTFVLFDMDGFKSVNDNYGHLVGDWVLKKAVSVCIPCWRQNDIAGRLGGEEFALMLPTCNMERAQEIAEQCRKAIEAVDTSDSGHKFPLSASFGITTTRFSGYEFSQVIGDADKTMYQAKAAGKNQVCCVDISDD